MVKPSGDLFHSIHLEASRWGTANEGRFGITLVVGAPVAYEYWTGKPFPKNPAAGIFPIQAPIGFLMEERKDKSWPVNGSTDKEALTHEITQTILAFGLPFFSRYPNGLALLDQLRAGGKVLGLQGNHFRLVHAMLAKGYGFSGEATEQIQNALKEAGTVEFKKQFVTEMGRRIGVL